MLKREVTDGTDGTGIRVRKRTDCSEMNRLFDNGQYFFMEMSWNQ